MTLAGSCESPSSGSGSGSAPGSGSPSASNNEILSLYGKLRTSRHSEDNTHHTTAIPGAQPRDPNRTTQWPGVIDELNWMLGQAIDSAQSAFGHPIPPHPTTHTHHAAETTSPAVSQLSSYSEPSDELTTADHPAAATGEQPSKENLTELTTTSSSLSDYSDGLEEEDRRETIAQPSITQDTSSGSNSGSEPKMPAATIDQAILEASTVLKSYPTHGLHKYQADALAQDCSTVALSTEESVESLQLDGAQTVYSEHSTSAPSTHPSHTPLIRRSPSFKLNNFITRKYKDLVSSRKSEPIHNSPPPLPIDPQTPTPAISAVVPSQDSTPMNSPMMCSPNKPIIPDNTPARSALEEEQRKIPRSPSSAAKALMARSAVVKRSSSDMNFLEQWQWLESQHPSSKKSSSNLQNSTSSPSNLNSQVTLKPSRASNPRETCLRKLNDHFTCADSAQDYFLKLALLSQRQQHHQQFRRRTNGNKSIKNFKPTIPSFFQGVPTIDTKEFKKVKTSKDRCRIYEAKLQQLAHHPTGLDLWIWLQTRGEVPRHTSSTTQEVAKFPMGSSQAVGPRPLRTQANANYNAANPFINLHPSTELPPPPLDPSFLPFTRDVSDVSMSSIASFPPRDGVIPHKAIQIKDKSLVEMGRTEAGAHRANGMVVNSLMEVNNLPYPSLYPHSTQRGISPSSSSEVTHPLPSRSIVTQNNNPGLPKKSVVDTSSSTSKPAGFFSQLTRQNSTRRNEHSSPSKNNLNNSMKILPALISAPISAPKGPRPDHGNVHHPWQEDNTNHSEPMGNGSSSTSLSSQEMTTSQIEEIKTPLSLVSSTQQRKSFAYGTQRQQARNPTIANHRYHNSTASCWTPVHQDPPPVNHHPLGHNNEELKSKLLNLRDILPNADQNLLEKILIESNLNDILAIGTYLELSQGRK